MPQTDEKRISCKRCQRRKIKCSRTSPCRRCMTAGVHCEYRDSDSKRAPISREYVTALECRIASLEREISKLKSAPCRDSHEMIEDFYFVNRPRGSHPAAPSDVHVEENGLAEFNFNHRWRRENDGTLIYHGPSSVYNTAILRALESWPVFCSSPSDQTQLEGDAIPRGRVIEECLALYFRCLHASFPLINKDEFLLELTCNAYSTENCSSALVYALSALGALMSDDSEIRGMAESYSSEAKRRLSATGKLSSIAKMQASILCALYEAGLGDSSSSCLYSGLILGAVEDRVHWPSQREACLDDGKKSGTSPVNNYSWTRMHMNCYISDKILGLMFGRAAPLSEDDGLLLDDGISTKPNHVSESYIDSPPISNSVDTLSVTRKHFELARIIHDMLALMYDPTLQPNRLTTISVTELNVRLCGWYDSLPTELRWNRWGSCFDEIDLGVAALHMLYHTTRISLNRHLLTPSRSSTSSHSNVPSPEFMDVCSVSIDMIVSILQRYKAQHSLKAAPLIFVHGAITAVDVLLSTVQYQQDGAPMLDRGNLTVLDDALESLSHSWGLACAAKEGIRKLMQDMLGEKSIPEEELTPSVGSGNETQELTPAWDQFGQDFQTLQSLELDIFDLDRIGETLVPDKSMSCDADFNEQINMVTDESMFWADLKNAATLEMYDGFGV